MNTNTRDFGAGTNEMFDTMTDAVATTMRTTAQFTNETMRFMNDMMTRGTETMRGTMERFATDMAPSTRKNMDRFAKMLDEQTRRNADFVRGCTEMGATTNPTQMTEQFATMWRDGMTTMRETFDMFTQNSVEMCENFGETMREAMTPNAPNAPKATNKTTKTVRGK